MIVAVASWVVGSADMLVELFFIGVVIVVALIDQVLRSSRRRRRVRRHVEKTGRPLQTAFGTGAFMEFAESMGFEFVAGRVPRVEGRHGDLPFRLDLLRRGMPRTRIRVALPGPMGGKLTIRHSPRARRGRFSRPTGDAEFDREFRVVCFTPGVAERVVSKAS